MSGIIVNPKNYTGRELETIFFRPLLSGPSVESLGIRVLYNMPVPTVVQLWDRTGNVLQSFDEASSWGGDTKSTHYQTTIPLQRVKAETAFGAADYFSTVLWLGDKGNEYGTGYTSFDGLLKLMTERIKEGSLHLSSNELTELLGEYSIKELFDKLIRGSSPRLKALYPEGEVAFFVSSRLYELYEDYLDDMSMPGGYEDTQFGRGQLKYHGFPVIELNLNPALASSTLSHEFCIFTDRRNLVMAVNTADTPGSEVRMWYNPDEMENRQRAVFAIGCEILDDDLVSAYMDVTI